MTDINPIEVYTYLLTEINKLGNEEVMRSMLNKYMLDAKDPKFVVQLGVCLLTEIRQTLDKLVDWDDDPEKVAEMIHKKYQRWNQDEIRHADIVVKTSAEVVADREQREANKLAKELAAAEDQKKRKAAKKSRSNKPTMTVAPPKKVKLIGNVGGYALERVIQDDS